MQFNQVQFARVVEAAKIRAANSPRWLAAIDKAVAGLNSSWIVTELADGIMVTTGSSRTYRVNGRCQCKAFQLNKPCKHRALARLIELYNQGTTTAPHARQSWQARSFERCARLSRRVGYWRQRVCACVLGGAHARRTGDGGLRLMEHRRRSAFQRSKNDR